VKPTADQPTRWRRLLNAALDLVYPPACELCSRPLRGNRWLCDDCSGALPRLTPPFCERCAEPVWGAVEGSVSCLNCQQLEFAFQFARPALRNDPDTRRLVHDLKYHRRIHLAAELGRLAAEAFDDPRLATALAGRWPLVPVPLHRSRQHRRHFNQSLEIARTVAAIHGLPVIHALRRCRDTGTQTRLSRSRRLDNLHGAFKVTLAGRRLARGQAAGAIVFDDVFTTGATSHECARVLRRAGVQKVVVVTVMRG